MTAVPDIRVVCPACGEAHRLGLAALRNQPEHMIELIQELAEVEADNAKAIAHSAHSLRQIRVMFCIVGTMGFISAGFSFGGADLVPKWASVFAGISSGIVAFTAGLFCVDLKIWSLKP